MFQARWNFVRAEFHIQLARVHVKNHHIAITQSGDGAAQSRFRGHVSHHQAAGRATEPPIRKATDSPSPSPTSAPVTPSISRIPGPPRGPSYRITTTSPGLMLLLVTA